MNELKTPSPVEAPNTTPHAQPSTMLPAYMPSLLDREIHSSDSDAFGHEHFAKALESLVEADTHKPPYSIGLLGKWGTGKSSIKSLYLESLTQDRRKGKDGKFRYQRVHAITFNAWRFGGENIRRALLRHVYIALGGDEAALMDTLFNQVQKPTQVPKNWKDIWREIYDKWLWTLLQVLVVAAALVVLTLIAARILNLTDEWVIATILAIESLLVGMLLKYLLDAKRFAISRFATINRVELPTVSAEQFEKLLIDKVLQYRKENPDCCRLVVFVDDLDRLSAEEMVSGLDAIRTFMEIPLEHEELSKLGLVFVISCDEDRVADALANRRKDPGSDLPGVILTRTDARRYLDRIFQFRLEIPPFPRQDMRSFAVDKLKKELPEIAASIREHGATVEEVVSRMIHVGVQSPRNALQIINAFVESWWVAEHREREGAGTNKRGALAEGAVTGHPLALAAVSALRVDFPDFYGDLQKEPDLIGKFLDVFVHSRPLSREPERVRFILERYALPIKEGEAEDAPRRLKDGGRPLRQYLNSVASVPWPKSLQPILLLSQDPVSRKIGDGAYRILDAFVSGDVQGVLADLGRDKDERKFDTDQINWLRDLTEQIDTETDDRRDNAGAVLAALAPRYPEKEAPHLLVPLARRLATSVALRSRVGVESAVGIVPLLPEPDRRRVVGSFVRDLLSSSQVQLKLPTGETPSLDEGVAMCRVAAELALGVRTEIGLDPADDERFLDWLVVRRVAFADKEYQFSFADLEAWMNTHGGHLLQDLGGRYLSVVADALRSEEAYKGVDLDRTRQRMADGLSALYAQGEESRQLAWDLACRYARVSPTEASEVSQAFFRRHADQADIAVVSKFVGMAAERVLEFIGDDALDEVDLDAVRLFITTTSTRGGLSDATVAKVRDACLKMSKHKDKAELAVELAQAMAAFYPDHVADIVEDWAERALSDLPLPCARFAFQHYGDLMGEAGRASLTKAMTDTVQLTALTEEQAERYRLAVDEIPALFFQEEPLRSHLGMAIQNFQQRYSDVPYLRAVFPAAPKIVNHAEKPSVGSMLHTLTANARDYPEAFKTVHETMAGNWPGPDPKLSPYTPDNVFSWAVSFVRANPSFAGNGAVLSSAHRMIKEGLVDSSQEENLVAAIKADWPNSHEATSQVLRELESLPAPGIIAGLSAQLDPEPKEGHTTSLKAVWQHFSGRYGADGHLEAIRSLLARRAATVEGHADGFLYLWCDTIVGRLPEIVTHLLDDDSATEEQKLRAWKQVEARVTILPRQDIIPLLEKAVLCCERTAKSALEVREEINSLYPSNENKHELGRALLRVYPNALNLESKNGIAGWLQDLGNEAILRNVEKGDLSKEDIEILGNYFPSSKHIQKMLEQ